MKFVRLSVKSPVFVNLLMVVVLVWGFMTYQDMNREAFPQVSRDMITVTTTYPGAPPTEMEQLVTIPIENAVANVDNVDEVESHSVQSRSVVLLKLHSGVDDTNRVLFDVQNEIDQISDLPDQADEPEVSEVTTNFPVITVGLKARDTESGLYRRAEALKDRFRTVEGVNDVKMMGKRERKIWIDVDPLQSRHYNIYLPEIYQSVQDNSLNQPGGRITGPVRDVLVRTLAKVRDSSTARKQVSRPGELRSIRVEDLASVYPGFEKWETRGRINGAPGVSMTIFKKEEADAISLVKRIKGIVGTINESRSDLELTTYRNLSQYIRDRLDTMIWSAVLALILVLIVLFVTLNGRIALITALGIPVSVYGSFVAMQYLGLTVNMITLFAFIIVLGIIVDDAIVITENIYRYMEMGHSPEEAAVEGTREVYAPVLATVITNIIAFLPLTMIGGLTGKFMVSIPYVVTIALLVSLFEAFVILPSHMADFVRVDQDRSEENGHTNWREVWIRPFRRAMTAFGSFCLRYRYPALIILLALMAGTFVWGSTFPLKFFHMEDIKMFRINLRAPAGTSLERTTELARHVEEKVETDLNSDNIHSYISSIGWQRTRLGDLRYAPERAQVEIELVDPKQRDATGGEIISKLRTAVTPFHEVEEMEFIKQQAGPPTGQPVEIELTGPDLDTLRSLANSIRDRLTELAQTVQESSGAGNPPIFDVKDNIIQGKSELRVRPLPDKTGEFGITNQQVAQTVTLAIDGLEASNFQGEEEEIEVMVRADPEFTSDPDNLRSLRIPIGNNEAVPLGEVASLSVEPAPGQINRLNRERSLMVSASVDKNRITGAEVNQRLKPFLEELTDDRPEYDYNLGGEYEEQNEAYRNLGQAALIALLAIYTVLAGLFNSFLEPFVIVLAVPFSLFGVFFGLSIMGKAITLTAAMGTVALAGIVVNDALILLKFVDQYEKPTQSNQYYGILRAIRLRVRPVLLTTLTTMAGLAPIAFEIGLSGVESFLSPMAIAIFYGLGFATLVTLIIVPLVYVTLRELRSTAAALIGLMIPG